MFVHDNNRILRCLGVALLCALTTLRAFAHQPEATAPLVSDATPVTATGTVTELTVSNQATGVSLRYFGLKLDQGTSYA